jgi:hypothetical protein
MSILTVVVSACLAAAGCSGFEPAWENAVADYRSGATKSPFGPWSGTWTTTTDGHSGNLRAIVTPVADRPDELAIRYHATWGRNLSGTYRARHRMTSRPAGRFEIAGTEKIGLFGTFTHKAVIRGGRFDATFSSSKGDLGHYSLGRPPQ